jgi:hypothetical protein
LSSHLTFDTDTPTILPLTRSDLLARLDLIAGILDIDDVAESYRITCARRLVRRLELDLGGADACRLVPDRGSDRAVGGAQIE